MRRLLARFSCWVASYHIAHWDGHDVVCARCGKRL